jgi:formate hydrogenlyase transcriptional activator
MDKNKVAPTLYRRPVDLGGEVKSHAQEGVYRGSSCVLCSVLSNQSAVNGSSLDKSNPIDARLQNSLELRRFIDRVPALGWSALPDGSLDYVNGRFLDYTGVSPDELHGSGWKSAVHPDDIQPLESWSQELLQSREAGTTEVRLRRFDGSYRWFLVFANPLQDESGSVVAWYGTNIEIEDRKRREEVLQTSELSWRQIIDNIPGLVATTDAMGEIVFDNRQILEYFGKTNEELKDWGRTDVVHPEDLPSVIEAWTTSIETGQVLDIEVRLRRADGVYRWFQTRAVPARDADGKISNWFALHTDIEDRKRAEEKLRQRERDLNLMINAIPAIVGVLRADGSMLYANQAALDYTGVTAEDLAKEDYRVRVYHPEDLERQREKRRIAFTRPEPFETEQRVLGKDGQYRWFLSRHNPVLDEQGRIDRWYVGGFDIEDRKRAEDALKLLKDQLYKDNLALREEVERTSMFDEIVGTSTSLNAVLSRISKVAPTDSTVLITGETGTGKELIARAIHKESRRVGRPFVSVNCAAIPRDLILSELFGHEKGAFTGATQRRLGRFELADGGTIFLDEVGELLPDVQVALLRVLQERELERVGGGKSIHIDVRVIAATNRDLEGEVANGTFRRDLFYRLNVFPIEVPPLRERKDDLLLLVEYFVQRYGVKAGRDIRSIDKKTLDLLQSYDWPGNIRELQNVIERSVILCPGDVLSVDASWLSKRSFPSAPQMPLSAKPHVKASALAGGQNDPRSERAMIEAALSASRGRVSGPSGAAARLGIPSSTLSTRIKALKIDKVQFKFR